MVSCMSPWTIAFPIRIQFTDIITLLNADYVYAASSHGPYSQVTHSGGLHEFKLPSSLMESPITFHLWILVGGFNPSEKHESQLGWLFHINEKIKFMFQTTNQNTFDLMQKNAIPHPDFTIEWD